MNIYLIYFRVGSEQRPAMIRAISKEAAIETTASFYRGFELVSCEEFGR